MSYTNALLGRPLGRPFCCDGFPPCANRGEWLTDAALWGVIGIISEYVSPLRVGGRDDSAQGEEMSHENFNGQQPGSTSPQPPVGYGAQPQQPQPQAVPQQPQSAPSGSAFADAQSQAASQQAAQGAQPQAASSGFSFTDSQAQAASQPPFGQPAPAYGAPVPPPPMPQQPRRSRGWIVALAVVAALLIAALFGMWSCTSALTSAATGTTASAASTLTSDAVAIIELDDTIQYDGTACSPEGLKALLDEAASNNKIVGVVLRVNSGGGVATAGEEMTEYLKEFQEETGKPVVVSSAASNCSAAYEISSQADYIYVANTTSIGAIGTAMQMIDYSGLLELLGIEITYYQNQINAINELFIQNVAEGRNMDTEAVRTLATGLTFTGMEAVENGLADEVGTLEDAVNKAASLANCTSYTTVELEQSSATTDLTSLLSLMSTNSNSISAEDLAAALKELESNGSLEQ